MEVFENQLLNIMGTGRNGSSLLLRLLDGNRSIFAYPIELSYFNIVSVMNKQYGIKADNRWINFISSQEKELKDTYLKKLKKSFKPDFEPGYYFNNSNSNNDRDNTLFRILSSFKDSYEPQKINSKIMFAFKSIDVSHAEKYDKEFPTMKFIHIIRNPVDVYNSSKRTMMVSKNRPYWAHGKPMIEAIIENRWIKHASFISEKIKIKPEKHFLVRFEDLVNQPNNSMKQICNWLKVEPHKSLNRLTVLGGMKLKSLPGNSSHKNKETSLKVEKKMRSKLDNYEIVTQKEHNFIMYRTKNYYREFYNSKGFDDVKLVNFGKWLMVDKWDVMNFKFLKDYLRFVKYYLKKIFYILPIYFKKD